MSEHRKKEIKIRLSESEFKRLNELKTKARLAEWIRETCLNENSNSHKVITKTADPELIIQVAKIGNNLNQIGRAVNRGDFKTLVELRGIREMLEKLIAH